MKNTSNIETQPIHRPTATSVKAVITVIGKDRAGIIAEVSAVLYKCNVNILDITQTTLQDYFTMITLVDLEKMNVDYSELCNLLDAVGDKLGLKIQVQHEKIFDSMHRI